MAIMFLPVFNQKFANHQSTAYINTFFLFKGFKVAVTD